MHKFEIKHLKKNGGWKHTNVKCTVDALDLSFYSTKKGGSDVSKM